MPTRRRNPATLVTALENAHTQIAEAGRLLDEAAEKLGRVGAAIIREGSRDGDVIAYASLADVARICDAALAARTLARGGAAAAKKAKESLIDAYEDEGMDWRA